MAERFITDNPKEHADQVGEFYFDIEVTDTAGYIDTPVKGRMIFNQDITK